MCKKVIFASKQKARKAARGLYRSNINMRVYQCERCYKWHLTTLND